MLLVRLLVNSRPLVVKFWGSQDLYTNFRLCGVSTSNPCIVQGWAGVYLFRCNFGILRATMSKDGNGFQTWTCASNVSTTWVFINSPPFMDPSFLELSDLRPHLRQVVSYGALPRFLWTPRHVEPRGHFFWDFLMSWQTRVDKQERESSCPLPFLLVLGSLPSGWEEIQDKWDSSLDLEWPTLVGLVFVIWKLE